MKDLAGLTSEDIEKLINNKILYGWDDDRICFPCPYSDDNNHYMIAFNTSDEQYKAYELLKNSNQSKEDTQMGNVTSINNRNKKTENASVQYANAELQRLLSVHTDMQAKNDQARLNRNVLALINTFAGQNHTSDTARYVVSIFQRLLSLKPLSPIMGTADEWREVTRSGDEIRTFQNKRCPSVFKKCDKMGVMLDCIDQDGLVLSTDGGFTWFTSGKMLKHISFPYMPGEGPEEVFVEEKDDGYIVITDPEKIEALYKDAAERAQAREQILK